MNRDNAAEGPVSAQRKTAFGCGCAEVRDKSVTHVLVRIASLGNVVKLILWQVDEGCEVSVVDDMREGVVGIETEILAEPLDTLNRQTVINGIYDIEVVIEKSTIGEFLPAEVRRAGEVRFADEQLWSAFAVARSAVGIEPPLGYRGIAGLTCAHWTCRVEPISQD